MSFLVIFPVVLEVVSLVESFLVVLRIVLSVELFLVVAKLVVVSPHWAPTPRLQTKCLSPAAPRIPSGGFVVC
jgi:hypothetical protein